MSNHPPALHQVLKQVYASTALPGRARTFIMVPLENTAQCSTQVPHAADGQCSPVAHAKGLLQPHHDKLLARHAAPKTATPAIDAGPRTAA